MAKKKTPPEAQPVKFEEAMQRLSEIAEAMEQGELPLEQLQQHFEEGMELARLCEARLTEVEHKVEVLMEQADGSLATAPFDEEPLEDDEDTPDWA